jgi:hypothetical protein
MCLKQNSKRLKMDSPSGSWLNESPMVYACRIKVRHRISTPFEVGSCCKRMTQYHFLGNLVWTAAESQYIPLWIGISWWKWDVKVKQATTWIQSEDVIVSKGWWRSKHFTITHSISVSILSINTYHAEFSCEEGEMMSSQVVVRIEFQSLWASPKVVRLPERTLTSLALDWFMKIYEAITNVELPLSPQLYPNRDGFLKVLLPRISVLFQSFKIKQNAVRIHLPHEAGIFESRWSRSPGSLIITHLMWC